MDRCVDRLVSRAEDRSEAVRSYARRTYCERFAREGWLDDDGVVSIEAVRALAGAEECENEDGGACAPAEVVDCALLHHVRRAEAQAYVRELGGVECDDGTPLDRLGVP